jgi:hypothetical protein
LGYFLLKTILFCIETFDHIEFYKRKETRTTEIEKMVPKRQTVPPSARVLTAHHLSFSAQGLNVILLGERRKWGGLWVCIQEINDIEELPVASMDGMKSWQFEQQRHSHMQLSWACLLTVQHYISLLYMSLFT